MKVAQKKGEEKRNSIPPQEGEGGGQGQKKKEEKTD